VWCNHYQMYKVSSLTCQLAERFGFLVSTTQAYIITYFLSGTVTLTLVLTLLTLNLTDLMELW